MKFALPILAVTLALCPGLSWAQNSYVHGLNNNGQQHKRPDTVFAGGLSNMARFSLTQGGNAAETEKLFKQALEIDEKAVGETHILARDLIGLASLYCRQHRYSEAEPLVQRALAIDEKESGPGHTVARDLNCLAAIYYAQGRYPDAESLCMRALSLDQQQETERDKNATRQISLPKTTYSRFGPTRASDDEVYRQIGLQGVSVGVKQPAASKDLLYLSEICAAQHKYDQAIQYCERAKALDEKLFGPNDLELATDLGQLSKILRLANRGAEAAKVKGRMEGITGEPDD